MQLVYRGIRFEASPQTLETSPSFMTGKYRGCPFRVHQLDLRVPVAAIALLHRGVTYLSARYSTVMPSQTIDSQSHPIDFP